MRTPALHRIAASAAIVILLASCSSDSSSTAPDSEQATQTADSPTSPIQQMLPALPSEIYNKVITETDYVDFLFYNFEFSMSMDERPGINVVLGLIDPVPAARPVGCQAIGRIFYQAKGENIASAQLYFTNGCTYLEWLIDEQPAYATRITDAGQGFLNNQFRNLVPNYQDVQ